MNTVTLQSRFNPSYGMKGRRIDFQNISNYALTRNYPIQLTFFIHNRSKGIP